MASQAIQNALQSTKQMEVQQSKAKIMKDEIAKMRGAIQNALPKGIDAERFQRVVLSAFSSNPNLQKCSKNSFMSAMMQSAALGLEPNTPLGQAYLIPYETKYGWVVQFQIGYKGLLELAQRSGKIKTIYSHEVCENDEIEIEYGLNQMLRHRPNYRKDRGEVIGYYAVYQTINGGSSFEYMAKDEVIAFAKKKSQAMIKGKSSPWQTDFNEMAKKTVIKKLLKYAPINIEAQQALAADETVKSYRGADELLDVLDLPPDDYIDVEGTVIDEETGEVLEEQSASPEATATIDRGITSCYSR